MAGMKAADRASRQQEDRLRLIAVARRAGLSEDTIRRGLRVGNREPLPGRSNRARGLQEQREALALATGRAPPEIAQAKTLEGVTAAFLEELNHAGWPMTLEDLRSTSKIRTIAGPRMVAMWLCRNIIGTDASFPKIVKAFGRKDHTTAMHAINMGGATKAMQRDPMLGDVAQIVLKRFLGEPSK
jgi:DNA-binding transcriptional MerR regulator